VGNTSSAEARQTFCFYAFRFHFRARDELFFPAGKAGNVVRGAFGTIFRRLACVPECTDARTCPRRRICPYARIFEPASLGELPSGLADLPRPFVFRAAHLDGLVIRPAQPFHFDVHIFELRDPALFYFVRAFAELAREGLGPERGRAELFRVDQLGADRERLSEVFDGESILAGRTLPPIELSLAPCRLPVDRVRVRFRTPTELKAAGKPVLQPEFGILFARIRDRISTLRALYGPGPLEIDFRGMGERAARVRLVRSGLNWVALARLSSKTGRRHPLGGFIGEAEYEGELAEFLPYLEAARWTGVGRQTVWGKGEIEVEAPDFNSGPATAASLTSGRARK